MINLTVGLGANKIALLPRRHPYLHPSARYREFSDANRGPDRPGLRNELVTFMNRSQMIVHVYVVAGVFEDVLKT